MRDREVIGARDDGEETGRKLRGIGAGIEAAVVGEHMHPEAGHLTILAGGDLRRHMIIACEGGGGEILDAVLDPLHRPARHDRGDDGADIAGIGADLVAEAAADVRGNHVDLVFRYLREQRGDRTDHVRSLEGAVDGELALDLVE